MTATYARYRHLAIERPEPAPPASAIRELEVALGAPLPDGFVRFLSVANGGYLDYSVDVPTGDGDAESVCFCGLFSVGDAKAPGTFLYELGLCRQYMGLPAGVLPIARDGGGSILFLDLSDAGQGRVVAFVEGLPEWTGLRTESGLVTLAPSFESYLDLLHVDLGSVMYDLSAEGATLEQVEGTEEWLDVYLPSWRGNGELVEAVASARRRLTTRCS